MRLFLLVATLLIPTLAPGAEPRYQVEVVAEGLDHPWSIAFLPDGDALVTERSGSLLRLASDGTVSPPIDGVPAVFVRSQAGLFDVLLDPAFPENSLIYLSYAHGDRRANTLRVARARLQGDRIEDLEVIFHGSPEQRTAAHYGGRLAWMPDGTLLITTGDAFAHREDAQRLNNTFGKTIRLHSDGRIPEDNPFLDDADALDSIWTFGHRNAQGLVVLPDGSVYQHEHGPQGGDELNRLRPGRNYGWPVITYGIDYTGARISPFTEYPGMEQPLVDWTPSIAPSGLTYYDGEAFSDWRGSLFVGGLAEQRIRRVELTADGAVDRGPVFPEIQDRIRDVRTSPDGLLYVLTDSPSGRILRVVPADE